MEMAFFPLVPVSLSVEGGYPAIALTLPRERDELYEAFAAEAAADAASSEVSTSQ